MSKKVPSELKYWLSSHEILHSLRINISDTPRLICIVAGYFLSEAYGAECCFAGEKRRHFNQQSSFHFHLSLGSKECVSEKLREEDWRMETFHHSHHTCATCMLSPNKSYFCTAMLHADLGEKWA